MDELISKLRLLKIKLNVVDGKLKINAPKGVVTKEIVNEIKANKEKLIEAINKHSGKEDFYKIPKAEEKEYYSLSLAQSRLYFIHLLDPQSISYNMPQFCKITGKLDVEKFQEACKKLIDRHESFRTRFSIVDDNPVQQILPAIEFEIEQYTCAEPEVEGILESFVRPFDLSKRCVRIGLIKIEDEKRILMIDTHHMINDGESNAVILEDLERLYIGMSLPPIDLQYKDYSEWQNSDRYKKALEAQKDFWKARFENYPGPLNLIPDYKKGLSDTNNEGGIVSIEFDKKTSLALKKIALGEKATLFMLMLALLNILISKLAGRGDVTIGTTVAGRQHPDLQRIVGMFVNSLPIRNFVGPQLSFKSFLANVMSSAVSSFDNQDFHYEQLINELNLERAIHGNALFNILFDYQNFDQPENELDAELKIESYDVGHVSAKFDLIIATGENDDQIYLNINYALALFKKETIEKYTDYIKNIASQVIQNIEVKIEDIQLFSAVGKKQMLFDFNDTKVEYPAGKSIIDLFEEQALRTPENIALVYKNAKISYQDLNHKANQFAAYLKDTKGIKSGDFIGVYVNRNPSLLIALLGILKSGAAYLPIDAKTSIIRINKIVKNAELKFLVTDVFDKTKGLDKDVEIIDLRKEKEKIVELPGSAINHDIKENDAAYIIYTSGSTGTPKGILIEHASVADYAQTFKNYFSITEKDKFIQQASLAFDTALEEIFPALISGASVLMLPEGALDIDQMINVIKKGDATVLSTTPLVLNELNNRAEELEKLRIIISGGDLLLPAHIDNILKKKIIYNTYGPSEATVCITYNKIESIEDVSLLGKPIANREVYILNEQGGLSPILVPGELCVSGKGLARGYINNKELTDKQFVKNPFVDEKKMYKTGDLARWLPDGNLEFLGRIDNQVKVRGFRIETGEIENELSKHESIREVTVVVKDKNGDKYLVAYYAAKGEFSTKELSDFLAEKLPFYMVPAYFIAMDSLPRNQNGKIDFKELPEPAIKKEADFMPPTTETEEALVKIWAEILDLNEKFISINASFFDLGGHSLKAINLISRIEKQFSVKVKLQTIFEQPTIRDLGKSILMSLLSEKPKNSKKKVTI